MANFNFNQTILGGRLVADPEVKSSTSGVPVCSFKIAVNRRDKEQGADYFDVVAWRSTAEFVGKHFRKGSSICVVGELRNRNWTDKEGNKKYATDVIADKVSFVDSKNDAQGTNASAPTTYMPEEYFAPPKGNFEDAEADPDIPF